MCCILNQSTFFATTKIRDTIDSISTTTQMSFPKSLTIPSILMMMSRIHIGFNEYNMQIFIFIISFNAHSHIWATLKLCSAFKTKACVLLTRIFAVCFRYANEISTEQAIHMSASRAHRKFIQPNCVKWKVIFTVHSTVFLLFGFCLLHEAEKRVCEMKKRFLQHHNNCCVEQSKRRWTV